MPESGEPVVFPVERDECFGAGRVLAWIVVRPGLSGPPVRRMQTASAVGPSVIRSSIVSRRSTTSWG